MEYLKVHWRHEFQDEPTIIYFELDEQRNEVRKIEMYCDGSFGLASKDVTYNNSILSEKPIPVIEEIMSDSQFRVLEINKFDFLKLWNELVKKI